MNAEIYEIIKDELAFEKFRRWLPECLGHEQFYVCLFARKKYCDDPAVKYDKSCLKRFVSSIDYLCSKVRQLECREGSYTGFENRPIPQEALALYMNLNPRDLNRSFLKGIKAFVDEIDHAVGPITKSPKSEVLNVIQKTRGRTVFHVFDIDNKDEDNLKRGIELVNGNCTVIETRGGFHLLVHAEESPYIEDNKWYTKLKQMSDVTGDALTPIVGCVQGDFVPRFKFYENQFV